MERLLDTEEIIERLPYSASPQEIRFQADILAIQSIAHSLPLFATELAVRHLNRYLRHIVPVVLALTLTSCVAPSMTIYGRGQSVGKDGISRSIAVKEFQMYGDSVGRTTIAGSTVSFTSEGGVYHSTVVHETGELIAKTGRTWFQPLISWLGMGSVINNAAGVGTTVAP